ncbi:MAG: type II secretion system protein [Planctomycetota bacterium]
MVRWSLARPPTFSYLPYRMIVMPPPRGFTLIELLVVISIIALLIGIVLPVLGSARESGRATACLSNLRQMMIAAMAYAADEADTMPTAYDYEDFMRPIEWDYRKDFSTSTVEPGLLWRGRVDREIQQCPSFEGSSNSPLDPFTGYNYNTSYLGGFRNGPGLDPVPSARLDTVKTPAQTAAFGDGEFQAGANKFMRAPRLLLGQPNAPHDAGFSGRQAGTQGLRHHNGNATNVAWVDGHADNLDQLQQGGLPVAPETGFLSDDNSLYDLD